LLQNFRIGVLEKLIVIPSDMAEDRFEGSSSERALEFGRTKRAIFAHAFPQNFSGVVSVDEVGFVV
jgi:hypothetical protein